MFIKEGRENMNVPLYLQPNRNCGGNGGFSVESATGQKEADKLTMVARGRCA